MDFLRLNKIFATNYYAVPDYQRDYEWTTAENGVLSDDIFSLLNNTNENHFFGAIVTIPYEEDNGVNKSIDFDSYSIDLSNVKHVVDGQQRLTSLSIFCQALIDSISEDESIDSTIKTNQCNKIKPIVKGNDYSGDKFAPKLILNGNTGKCYNKYILNESDDICNKGYKGAKRISSAYSLFTKEINDHKKEFLDNGWAMDSLDFYKKLIKVVTEKIEFVEIACSESSNAFQVFDSLNGKGLDLTAADRIKNIFLSWSPSGKGIQKWDSLISDVGEEHLTNFFVSLFFAIKDRRISKNKLPDNFREAFKDSAENNFDYFFNKLHKRAQLFGKIRQCKTGNATLDDLLKDLNQLKSEQAYVILFSVADYYDNENILNNKEYTNFVKNVISLIVRIQVCEKSTNKLDSIFSKCISKMKNGGTPVEIISQVIKDEIHTIASDDEFKTSFINFSPEESRVAEYYLRSLENRMRTKSGDRTKVERGLTVEHIIPSSIDLYKWYEGRKVPDRIVDDAKYLLKERIGNKALLYGDDNSSANDHVYKDKLLVYKNGKQNQSQGKPYETFELIKDLVNNHPDKFDDVDVDERSQRLADLALEIWS